MPTRKPSKKNPYHNLIDKVLKNQVEELKLLNEIKKVIEYPAPSDQSVSGFTTDLKIFDNSQLITSIKGKLFIMAIELTDSQQATWILSFVDKKNKPTDAASVVMSIVPAVAGANLGTISYDDPSNTVTLVAGDAGVGTISTVAKDSKGNVLPFADEALEVTAGDAVSGTRSEPVITEQP